jgi:hypothetical protein
MPGQWIFDKETKKWKSSSPVANEFSYLSFFRTLPLRGDREWNECQIECAVEVTPYSQMYILDESTGRRCLQRVRAWLKFLTDPLFARVFFPRELREVFQRDIRTIELSDSLDNGREDGKEDDKEIFCGQWRGKLECRIDRYNRTFYQFHKSKEGKKDPWEKSNYEIYPCAFRITYTEKISGCSCAVVFGFDDAGCLSGWFMEQTHETLHWRTSGALYGTLADVTYLHRCVYDNVVKNLRATFDTKKGNFLPYPFNPDRDE